MLRLLLLCGVCAALVGCAGSTAIEPDQVVEGFYHGIVTYDTLEGPTTASAVAEIDEQGHVALSSTIPAESSLTHTVDGYVLNAGGTILVGVKVVTQATSDGVVVQIYNDETLLGTATLAKEDRPTLGAETQMPTPGRYAGQILVVSRGKVVGIGIVSQAEINADYTSFAQLGRAGNWLGGSGILTSTFQPSGTLKDATLIVNGSVISLADVHYSNDGETLIIRMDNPVLEPSEMYLILRRVVE